MTRARRLFTGIVTCFLSTVFPKLLKSVSQLSNGTIKCFEGALELWKVGKYLSAYGEVSAPHQSLPKVERTCRLASNARRNVLLIANVFWRKCRLYVFCSFNECLAMNWRILRRTKNRTKIQQVNVSGKTLWCLGASFVRLCCHGNGSE